MNKSGDGNLEYLMMDWKHDKKKYPVKIYVEIDDQRYETRKIEVFLEGKIGFAFLDVEFCEAEGGDTGLGDQKMPELQKLLSRNDTVLKTTIISKEDFELLWKKIVISRLESKN